MRRGRRAIRRVVGLIAPVRLGWAAWAAAVFAAAGLAAPTSAAADTQPGRGDDPEIEPTRREAIQPDASRRDDARPEAESYVLHCSGCHRLDGSGVEGVAPDLRRIGPLLDSSEGRAYLGRVPGVAQAPLEDAALARLLNWVLAEIADRPADPAYTAQEIRRLRAEPLRDPLAARRALDSPEP